MASVHTTGTYAAMVYASMYTNTQSVIRSLERPDPVRYQYRQIMVSCRRIYINTYRGVLSLRSVLMTAGRGQMMVSRPPSTSRVTCRVRHSILYHTSGQLAIAVPVDNAKVWESWPMKNGPLTQIQELAAAAANGPPLSLQTCLHTSLCSHSNLRLEICRLLDTALSGRLGLG